MFPEGYYNEVQVTATVVSTDCELDPDIAAMLGTSAALSIAGIPFNGPYRWCACWLSRVNRFLTERTKS